MSEYTFNEHGVCTNPVLVHQDSRKEFTGEVKVFKAPTGKWGFGLSIRIKFGNMAYRSSPESLSVATYGTMSEARKAGMEEYSQDITTMLKAAKDWNERVAASHGNDHGDEGGGVQLKLF
jgi:hypothetical protein